MANQGPMVQAPTAEWRVGGKSYTFAVEQLREGRTNRIIQHKRVYRDGARLDDTGAEARTWTFQVLFNNDEGQEAGIDGARQYPDNVNAICDSFDQHEVGDLIVPTRGPRRCRAESYERIEAHDKRNACAVTFVWVEDNEDDASAATFVSPSAKSQNISVIAAAEFALEQAGIPTGSLNELANDLQGLAEAPGEFVSQFENRANALGSALVETERAYSKAATEARTEAELLLTDPENSRAGKLLRRAQDNTARVFYELSQTFGRPTVAVVFPNPLSLWDVAAKLGQDPIELAKLNASLDSLLEIPAGTQIQVYDDGPSQ